MRILFLLQADFIKYHPKIAKASPTLTCASPTDLGDDDFTDDIPDNFTLQQVIVLTRHGARSPISAYYHATDPWYCDYDQSDLSNTQNATSPSYIIEGPGSNRRRLHQIYDPRLVSFPPSCGKGQLLVEGMHQHYLVGKYFRDQYIGYEGNHHQYSYLLPDRYDPRYVYIRASSTDRTIKSAISFVSALYPATSPDDEVVITTGSPSLELLHPQKSQCKDLNDAYEEWIESDEYKEVKGECYPYLKGFIENATYNQNEELSWCFVGDWMATMYCTDHPFKPEITDEQFTAGIDAVQYYSFGFFGMPSSRGIAASPIMREILRLIEDRISGKSENKFSLLSAHDVSIVACLMMLNPGGTEHSWAPFASYFATEVYRDPRSRVYLRFRYNRKPVEIDFYDNKTVIPLSVFRSRAQKYLHFCSELP